MGNVIKRIFNGNIDTKLENSISEMKSAAYLLDEEIEKINELSDVTIPIFEIQTKLKDKVLNVKNEIEEIKKRMDICIDHSTSSILHISEYKKDAIKEAEKMEIIFEKINKIKKIRFLLKKIFKFLSTTKEYSDIEEIKNMNNLMTEENISIIENKVAPKIISDYDLPSYNNILENNYKNDIFLREKGNSEMQNTQINNISPPTNSYYRKRNYRDHLNCIEDKDFINNQKNEENEKSKNGKKKKLSEQ